MRRQQIKQRMGKMYINISTTRIRCHETSEEEELFNEFSHSAAIHKYNYTNKQKNHILFTNKYGNKE